jgi:Putative  PD-(D/E)XK family member, (DUF4420)
VNSGRHLTWENFSRDILAPAVPASHPIAGCPAVELFYAVAPARIGLSVVAATSMALPKNLYPEIQLSLQSRAVGLCLTVETRNESLFRPFFSLLLEIADAIQIDFKAPLDAILFAIDRFSEILQTSAGLSTEEAVGLWGELWVLEQLIRDYGPPAWECWTGCQPDRHDFRRGACEFEVKTTLRSRPEHWIHGLGQLVASTGFRLFLISIQVVRSDRGTTLTDRMRRIEALLARETTALSDFRRACKDAGLTTEKLERTNLQVVLREAPALIVVDTTLPRLLSVPVETMLGTHAFGRLLDVQYLIYVGGLAVKNQTQVQQVAPWLLTYEH